MVAALGVAVGGITAALGALLQSLFGLGFLMPLGILGMVLLISGPSMLIAWLKLRQRNLGPILDANGWAVNALTRVNIPLGRSLTSTAVAAPGLRALPGGPVRPEEEPVAEDHPLAPASSPASAGACGRPASSRSGSRGPRPRSRLGSVELHVPSTAGDAARRPPPAPPVEAGMDAGMGG